MTRGHRQGLLILLTILLAAIAIGLWQLHSRVEVTPVRSAESDSIIMQLKSNPDTLRETVPGTRKSHKKKSAKKPAASSQPVRNPLDDVIRQK